MNQQELSLQTHTSQTFLAWSWPVHLSDYDRRATLSEEEHLELDRRFVTTHTPLRKETWGVLRDN